jgi:DNA-binding NarL/FixJ family response regulator
MGKKLDLFTNSPERNTTQRNSIDRKAALSMREYGERTAVVLDEQPLWLEAMEQLLKRVGVSIVGKTTEPLEALDLVEQHRPDVLLADYGVSDGELDAVGCLRKAHEAHPDLKTVVLSATDQPQQIQAAFAAGASVFCVKTADQDDLMAAIRQAFEVSIYLADSANAAVSREPIAAAETPELTRREFEILQLVAEGHSNSQLATMLWVTEQTVKFHLSNIYRKLDVANRTEASRWAQLHGLLPQTPAETAA